jgi:N-acetylmuramoyl-L-alanine amidase
MAEQFDATTQINNNTVIFYVDPNQIQGKELIRPPEDLSISVELTVGIPQTTNRAQGDTITIELISPQKAEELKHVNFFGGTKIDNQNTLTDWYQDIGYNSEKTKEGGNKEALCIRSVNIEYNSWYLPQVSIQFVDVRGMALMNPMTAYKNDPAMGALNSFFAAFYTIPYPEFTLQVKGLYGDAVTYDLVAQDIRTTIDVATGNVIIDAQFVGYTFAMWADVPFEWIKTAPYNKYAQGDEYKFWRERHFKFDGKDGGTDMLTFPELYDVCLTTIRKIDKLKNDNESTKKKNIMDSMSQLLINVKNTMSNFCKDFDDNVVGKSTTIKRSNDEKGCYTLFIPLNGEKSFMLHKEELVNSGILANPYVVPYNSPNTGTFPVNESGGTTETPKKTTGFSIPFSMNNNPIENHINIVGGTYQAVLNNVFNTIDEYNKQINDGGSFGLKTLSPPPSLDKKNSFKNPFNCTNIDVKDNPKYSLPNGVQYQRWEFNYSPLVTIIDQLLNNDIKNGIEQADEGVVNEISTLINNSLKFTPTIGNMVKMIFAHFEVFMRIFFGLIEKTQNRRVSDLGITSDRIDTNTGTRELGECVAPWFAVWSKQEDGSVKCSPFDTKVRNDFKPAGEGYKQLEEIKFLRCFNDAFFEYNKLFDDAKNSSPMFNMANFWLPINPFDISNQTLVTGLHTTNPYKECLDKVNTLPGTIAEMIKEVGVRMFYGASTTDANCSKLESLAKAEAKNVFTAIQNREHLIGIIKEMGDALATNMVTAWQTHSTKEGNLMAPVYSVMVKPLMSKNGKYTFIMGTNNGSPGDNIAVPMVSINTQGTTIANNSTGGWFDWFVKDRATFNPNEWVPVLRSTDRRTDTQSISRSLFNIQPYNGIIDSFKAEVDSIDSTLTSSWDVGTQHLQDFFIDGLKTVVSTSNYNDEFNNLTEDQNKTLEVRYFEQDLNTDKIFSPNAQTQEWKITMGNRNGAANAFIPFFNYDGRSVFAEPAFYNLNKVQYTLSPELNYQLRDRKITSAELQKDFTLYSKLYVLFNTLNIDKDKITSYFSGVNQSAIRRIPKIVLLYMGCTSLIYDNNVQISSLLCPKMTNLETDFPIIARLKLHVRVALETYFVNWANMRGQYIINNLQLKQKINNVINSISDGTQLDAHITNILLLFNSKNPQNKVIPTEHIYERFDGKSLSNSYCGLYFAGYKKMYLVNRPGSSDVNAIMETCLDDCLVLITHYDILNPGEDRQFVMPEGAAAGYAKAFVTELLQLIGEKQEKSVTKTEDPKQKTNNEEYIYETRYYQFKKLYDRWLSWGKNQSWENHKLEVYYGSKNPENPSAVKIIDKFYTDISNVFICNLDVIKKMIEDFGESNYSLISVLSNLFSLHKCLFIPTPNRLGIQSPEELRAIFEPKTYARKATPTQKPGYTAVYIGEPNSYPTTIVNDHNGKFGNSKMDLVISDEPGRAGSNIPPSPYGPDAFSYPLPVFGVSFGKQNQSYFQSAEISNTNPTVTEQGIRAQIDIANKGKAEGVSTEHGGQDLYDVYSANAYQVTIHMLGCAQIMPLMYFQLTNAYLFTGCYMIFKMSHQISPGKMVTTFTGIKQEKQRPNMLTSPFFGQTLIGESQSSLRTGSTAVPTDGQKWVSQGVGYWQPAEGRAAMDMSKNEIKYIVLHCTAGFETGSNADTMKMLNKLHNDRPDKFAGIGYHYVIHTDGNVSNGRPNNLVGAHAPGFNSNSIGISYVGGVDRKNKALDTRTKEQRIALIDLVRKVIGEMNDRNRSNGYNTIIHVLGHYQVAKKPKACPSFDVQKWCSAYGIPWYNGGMTKPPCPIIRQGTDSSGKPFELLA